MFERNFKPGKRDLYAAFILRNLELSAKGRASRDGQPNNPGCSFGRSPTSVHRNRLTRSENNFGACE